MLKLQGVWSTFILFTKPKWLVKWCTHMQVLKIISMKLTVIYSSLNYAESTYGMKPSHCMFSNIWELCITHSSIIGQYSVFTYVHCNWHEIGVDFVQAVTSFIIRLILFNHGQYSVEPNCLVTCCSCLGYNNVFCGAIRYCWYSTESISREDHVLIVI